LRQRLSVELHAPPTRVRVVDGDLDAALNRRLQAAVNSGIALGRAQDRDRAARALDLACQQLGTARENAPAQIAKSAVELAVEIARTIVRSEIDSGRMGLEQMVREALHASGVGRAACVVHLHPMDAAALADVKFRAGTEIEPDEAVQRGDVHVSTPQGLLVREVQDALRSVRERLLAELAP
jgi:flagellar biosynthesis/type III secretory pathway protein FliH